MNYESMSDEQVSLRLFELVHPIPCELWCLSDCETFVYDCGPTGDYFHKIDLIDISNWSHIGPLIESYQIDVGFIDGFGWTAEQRGQHAVSVYNNPKRAAAICIIKLLESQK